MELLSKQKRARKRCANKHRVSAITIAITVLGEKGKTMTYEERKALRAIMAGNAPVIETNIESEARLVNANDVIEHAEVNGEDKGFILKLTDYLMDAPTIEPPTKLVAEVRVDSEEIVQRIKEEYEVVDGWIPCEERLPEEDIDDSYLIAWQPIGGINKICATPHFYQVADWEDGDWANLDCGEYEEIEILAWIPLPQPYCGAKMKGESDED